MIKKIYPIKKNNNKEGKPKNKKTKIYHQRFNSHIKVNNFDIENKNKLTVSLPKSDNSESRSRNDSNVNIRKQKTKFTKILKSSDNKFLKFKTTNPENKNIKIFGTYEKKKKDKIKKFSNSNKCNLSKINNNKNYKIIHNKQSLKKNSKEKNKKAKNKKTKSEVVFNDFSKNYFSNLCNLKIENTNLSAVVTNELFTLKNKIDMQKINANDYYNEIINTIKNYKIKTIKNLENCYEESKNYISELINKIENDKDIIDKMINEFKNYPKKFYENKNLINNLDCLNLDYKNFITPSNNSFEKPKILNYEEFKKNIKNINYTKKIKGIKEYNNSIKIMKNNFKNIFNNLELNNKKITPKINKNIIKGERKKKGCSLSMAFGDFIINDSCNINNNERIKYKIRNYDTYKNNKENKIDEIPSINEMDYIKEKENLDNLGIDKKMSYSSISLKCSEELDNPLREII